MDVLYRVWVSLSSLSLLYLFLNTRVMQPLTLSSESSGQIFKRIISDFFDQIVVFQTIAISIGFQMLGVE